MSKRIDLTGQKFERWTVISFDRCENDRTFWKCRCDCGNEKIIDGRVLRSGKSKSCGCLNLDSLKNRYKDLTGKRFGNWTVVERKPNKNKRIMWLCRCDCGTEHEVASTQLMCGASTSCGCKRVKSLKTKFTKHGMTKSRLYEIYMGMLKRCYNEKSKAYKRYGGIGIKVCDEWLGKNGFENFSQWSFLNGYADNLTLDRFPNQKGNYEPSNCRWATPKEQSNNRKTNVYITRDGETHTMKEWCDILEFDYGIVNGRKQRGWNEDRLFIPLQYKRRKK